VATSSDGQDVPELRQAAIADAGARSTDQEGERHATGLDVEEERHPTGLDMEGERHATGLDVNGERPTTFVDVVGEQRTAGLDVDEEPLSSALGSEDNQSSGFDIEQPTVGAEMADEGHDLGTEVTTESTTGLPEGYVGVPGFAGGTIVIGPDGQAITAEGLTELGVDPSGYENVHFEDSVEASSTSGDIEIGTVRNRQEPLQYDTNPSERLPAPPRVPQFDRHEPRAEQTTADGLRTSPPEPDRSSTDPEYYRPEADPKLRGPMPDPSNDHYRPRLEQTNDGPRTSSFEPRHSSALQSDLTQDFELSDDFDAAAGMFGDSADGIDTWSGADSGIDAPEVGQAAMPAATLDPLDDLGLPIPVAADVTVASIDVPELDLAYAHTQEAAGRLLDGDLSGAADAGFEAERDLSDGYNHARQQVEDTLLHFARENTGLADAATSDFAAIDDDSGAYEPVGTVEGITDDQGF
jgi:hypothetical protein